jgi:ParB-like chromosome segregation protein Spo0J
MPVHTRPAVATPSEVASPPELPEIGSNLREALESSLVARGCLVPIVVSSDGVILDGRAREAIGKKHGIFVPRVVVGNLDRSDKIDLRLVLNGIRRQLSQAQWREIVA